MHNNSFCVYRLPYSDKILTFKGTVENGLHKGFVIAPFNLENGSISTITNLNPAKPKELHDIISNDVDSCKSFRKPTDSTTKQEHAAEIEAIKKELAGNNNNKTIAAKVICGHDKVDFINSFLSLSSNHPSAFVFMFYTPVSGAWLGASPELLIEAKNEKWRSFALAGTRPANSLQDWDEKNISEQKIVTKYIVDKFSSISNEITLFGPKTQKAGNIEHILSEIIASVTPKTSDELSSFLSKFSPTPALCGFPKEESLERIQRLESFDRGFYGGFCGPFDSTSDFSLYVNLRSIMFSHNYWCMYVGGGITPQSVIEDEWIETERKSQGILSRIIFDD